jgi:hypothetical protein
VSDQDSTQKQFVFNLPLTIGYVTGIDPTTLPEHRRQMQAAVDYCLLAERLFWTVQQLGMVVAHEGWHYSTSSLADALESLGMLGQAAVNEASDCAQKLEHLAMHREEK